jgi:dCTP diphosphatase
MTDTSEPTVAELQALVTRFRDQRDWARFHTPKDLATAIGIEAAELQELFLWQDGDAQAATLKQRNEAVRNEIADIVILALAFAEATDIELAAAILEKLKINAAKYPVDQSKGTAAKYTDLPGAN